MATPNGRFSASDSPGAWILRECVRANPFYVISALLFGWGVLELSRSLDPKVWDVFGVCAVAGLIHVYEICLLAVATIVLMKRREGGRDMHGLLIVAALFLSGGLIALDEMSNLWPGYAPIWITAALLLAFVKLEWYGRLPGFHMPPRYRRMALVVLAAHCVPALLASEPFSLHLTVAQRTGLGWLAGWVSFVGVFVLLALELKRDYARLKDFSLWDLTEAELVRTHVPGVWLLTLTCFLGLVHAYVTDWIFDRPIQAQWTLPTLSLVAAMWLLTRFTFKPRWNALNLVLAVAPAVMTMKAWSVPQAWQAKYEHSTWLGFGIQLSCAASLAYVGLAWATQRRIFLLGLLGSAGAPFWMPVKGFCLRQTRSTVLITTGFLSLFGGMLISLYRERLLKMLAPQAACPPPAPSSPPPPSPPLRSDVSGASGAPGPVMGTKPPDSDVDL